MGKCRKAQLAIDGDWETVSRTDAATGTHWWQVSIANTTVYQVVLKARANNNQDITVVLYNGRTLVGQCQSHTGHIGSGSKETLSCDRVTVADRVKLSFTSTTGTFLKVYEMRVTGALSQKTGLYQTKPQVPKSCALRSIYSVSNVRNAELSSRLIIVSILIPDIVLKLFV